MDHSRMQCGRFLPVAEHGARRVHVPYEALPGPHNVGDVWPCRACTVPFLQEYLSTAAVELKMWGVDGRFEGN